jgi:AP-3 complex subunit delta-1
MLSNSSTSNWITIKLLKLFTILCSVEPRLLRKLAEPIGRILQNTTSKSVEYEAIRCVIRSFAEYPTLQQLASDRLTGFLESNDNNLKYLGLNALRDMLETVPENV